MDGRILEALFWPITNSLCHDFYHIPTYSSQLPTYW